MTIRHELMQPEAVTSAVASAMPQFGPNSQGEVEIAGRHYLTARRLAQLLGVTVRTLARWNAQRIGPPKISIGKIVLFDLAKLPEWLATREIQPTRNTRH